MISFKHMFRELGIRVDAQAILLAYSCL